MGMTASLDATICECVTPRDSRFGQTSASSAMSRTEVLPKKLSRRIRGPETRIEGHIRSKLTSLIVSDV
jgi:hypothetical protein